MGREEGGGMDVRGMFSLSFAAGEMGVWGAGSMRGVGAVVVKVGTGLEP